MTKAAKACELYLKGILLPNYRTKDQSFKKKFSHNLYDLLKELPNVASIIQNNDLQNYAKSLGVARTNNQNFLEIFCKKMIFIKE